MIEILYISHIFENFVSISLIEKSVVYRKVYKYIHIHRCMGTRTISITDDAYKRLLSLKKNNESFSIIIQKLTGKVRLNDFFGVLSKETADKLEENIRLSREKNRKIHIERNKKLKEEFF